MLENGVMTNLDFFWGKQCSITNADWSHLLHCDGWQVRHHFDFRNGLWTRSYYQFTFTIYFIHEVHSFQATAPFTDKMFCEVLHIVSENYLTH